MDKFFKLFTLILWLLSGLLGFLTGWGGHGLLVLRILYPLVLAVGIVVSLLDLLRSRKNSVTTDRKEKMKKRLPQSVIIRLALDLILCVLVAFVLLQQRLDFFKLGIFSSTMAALWIGEPNRGALLWIKAAVAAANVLMLLAFLQSLQWQVNFSFNVALGLVLFALSFCFLLKKPLK